MWLRGSMRRGSGGRWGREFYCECLEDEMKDLERRGIMGDEELFHEQV